MFFLHLISIKFSSFSNMTYIHSVKDRSAHIKSVKNRNKKNQPLLKLLSLKHKKTKLTVFVSIDIFVKEMVPTFHILTVQFRFLVISR